MKKKKIQFKFFAFSSIFFLLKYGYKYCKWPLFGVQGFFPP